MNTYSRNAYKTGPTIRGGPRSLVLMENRTDGRETHSHEFRTV